MAMEHSLGDPQNLIDVANIANSMSGGIMMLGFLVTIWAVSFMALLRRRYPALKAGIASNFMLAISSVLLWGAGLVGDGVPIFAGLLMAGSILYSNTQRF